MTLEQFIIRWNGKFIDFDQQFGPQCVDLARQYMVEVLNFPNSSIKPVVGAKDMYEKYSTLVDPLYFERIPNTPTGVPLEGDIVLWGNSTYGHVAVFVEGDTNSFRSFDQNYPTGSPCHIQNHTYVNCLGWLRPKQATLPVQSELDKCRIDRDSHWNDRITIANKLGVQNNMEVMLAELDKLIGFEDAVVQKDKQIQEANTKIAELEGKLTQVSFAHTELIAEHEALQERFTDQEGTIEDQGEEISSLSTAIEELKKQILIPVYSGWKRALVELIGKLPF
ncbi:MAG: hypothetical protein A2Y53_03880 [Chloroflexi bacterium RBG_16_47_49]|nr:MAG: hypothetical protein A2Y53_03880 [Chloroflexi bacterium RBG_16_47_49]